MKRYTPKPQSPTMAQLMAFWTRLVEKQQPRGRCRGCAFRAGTAANRCEHVGAMVVDVVLRGGDFRCHHATLSGRVVRNLAPARQCRGFGALMDHLRQRDAAGATKRTTDG